LIINAMSWNFDPFWRLLLNLVRRFSGLKAAFHTDTLSRRSSRRSASRMAQYVAKARDPAAFGLLALCDD
jgi:hypothetical protein